jgi:hypothetical protein
MASGGLATSPILAAENPPVEVWDTNYGESEFEAAWCIEQTDDGGYIMAGKTKSWGAGEDDFYLVKTNALGDKVWQNTFGGPGYDVAKSVKQTTNGYIIAGKTTSFGVGGEDFYLVKTNALGDKVWQNTFGGTSHDQAESVEPTTDSGYIIAGWTTSFGEGENDFYLVKTNASGDKVWQNTFGGIDKDEAKSVEQTTDSGYIIAGYTESQGEGGRDIYLVKTNASGDKVWENTFGGTSNDVAESVEQTTDGGYIIAGYTESQGEGGRDLYLVKTNALGDKVWENTFGGTSNDVAESVEQTTDGGYIIAGYTESQGEGGRDIYLVKTNASGDKVWENTFGGTSNVLLARRHPIAMKMTMMPICVSLDLMEKALLYHSLWQIQIPLK